MYICGDVDLDDEYDGCNEDGIAVNQCCQDCPKVNVCKHHCDFAHDFGCLAKEKGDGVERRVIQPVQTNADRIRAMSDEEVADYIISIGGDNSEKIPYCKSTPQCTEILESGELIPDEMCRECLIRWLQSEAEDN